MDQGCRGFGRVRATNASRRFMVSRVVSPVFSREIRGNADDEEFTEGCVCRGNAGCMY